MAREEEVHDFVTYYYVYFDGGGGYFIDLLIKGRCSILEIWVPYLVYIYYLMELSNLKSKSIDYILCQ